MSDLPHCGNGLRRGLKVERRIRAEKALKIVAELPDDPLEAIEVLDKAKRAYELSLGDYGASRKVSRGWIATAMTTAASLVGIGVFSD
jgi:hypothetical protein